MAKNFKIDVLAWLERHFDEVIPGRSPLVHVNCPYCHDTKARLYIAVEDGGAYRQGWGWCHNEKCYTTFLDFYSMLENISYAEAKEQLFSDNPEPPKGDAVEAFTEYFAEKTKTVKERPPVVWPIGYVPLYGLTPEKWQKRMPKYLVNRDLTQALCDTYFLGYSTNDPKHAGRLIVPIYQFGELVGFQGRSLNDALQPKYRFMDGISAGEYLYNIDTAIATKAKEVILVEGVFDVWGMIKAGYPNTVGSFGKHLTDDALSILIHNFESVLIFWDEDAKPEIIELAEQIDGQIQRRVTFLDKKDPGEASPEAIKLAVENAEIYSNQFKRNWLINSI